jgi:uncharacterized protein
LILGALIFGFAMQLADGCGSGTLYKAGASSPISWVVLPAFIVGSFVGGSHQPLWEELGGPLVATGLAQEIAPDRLHCIGRCCRRAGDHLDCLRTCSGSQRDVLQTQSLCESEKCSPNVTPRWLWGALAIAVLYALAL